MQSFEEFFHRATGSPPYGYQSRLAHRGLPAEVQAPTGAGKTGVILAWLWRRLHGPDPAATPRRLVYALPQRSVVEQLADQVGAWLANLGLADEVALHVAAGGEGASQRQWRVDMHRPAVVIGTADSLVSKILNRGYGIGRAIYPIDFALVTSGAQWIIDEARLSAGSTATLRQVAAFAASLGTAEPFGLTCMSAAIPGSLAGGTDTPAPGPAGMARIEPDERAGELAVRLAGQRTAGRLAAEPGDYPAIAAAARDRHRPGTLTLVVLNSVRAARDVFTALRGQPVPCALLHAHFRGAERERLIRQVTAPPGEDGRIVVATQVIEAALDIDAAVLITEVAPWPCLVQRAGRCNRAGRVRDAQLCWLPPAGPDPYQQADLDAAEGELGRLEGVAVTSEDLLRRDVPEAARSGAVLRRADLARLFDTADSSGSGPGGSGPGGSGPGGSGPGGAGLDIAPYVQDGDDLDAQLAWAVWEATGPDGRPADDARAPLTPWRCRAPLGQLAMLVSRGVGVWRLDLERGRWTRVSPADPARPGEVLLVAAADGGYHPELGFDPAARGPVPGCPALLASADLASAAEQGWVSLDRHSEDTRDQAAALLTAMRPGLPGAAGQAVVAAAYAHDAGKSHRIWQDALCRLAPPGRADEIAAGRPWAKSGGTGRLEFDGGVRFRHELASLLLLDGPLRALLATAADPDLVRYLVLAHHGKLRIQVREPADADPGRLLGLVQDTVEQVPPILGQPAGELRVDLAQFGPGRDGPWTAVALGLRDRYGPFVLAYLETVLRIADWRASAGADLPR